VKLTTNLALLFLAVLTAVASASPADTLDVAPSTARPEVSPASLEQRVREMLPPQWRLVETSRDRAPIGWDGPKVGLYLMVEDTRTRFFHPNGFHYYSFYRIWIMPSGWEGEMRQTPYVTDSTPAFLLGVADGFVAFYHTAGGNVWPDGPDAFCRALGINDLCHTSMSRRVIDLEFEERLLAGDGDDASLHRDRIIGLSGGGNALYMEYVFTSEAERPAEELSDLTDRIVLDVFAALPEIDSVYLRRCTSDTFTDTIVSR